MMYQAWNRRNKRLEWQKVQGVKLWKMKAKSWFIFRHLDNIDQNLLAMACTWNLN